MKILLPILLATSLASCGAAQADTLKHSPLLGTWSVQTARLPMPPEARPKSVTFHFSEASGGQLATRVQVVDPQGSTLQADAVYTLDGTPTPVVGILEADMGAATMPAPNVLVMQLARAGTPASTRVYTVSADRRHMTETSAYVGKDGRPVMRTFHFTRTR